MKTPPFIFILFSALCVHPHDIEYSLLHQVTKGPDHYLFSSLELLGEGPYLLMIVGLNSTTDKYVIKYEEFDNIHKKEKEYRRSISLFKPRIIECPIEVIDNLMKMSIDLSISHEKPGYYYPLPHCIASNYYLIKHFGTEIYINDRYLNYPNLSKLSDMISLEIRKHGSTKNVSSSLMRPNPSFNRTQQPVSNSSFNRSAFSAPSSLRLAVGPVNSFR